MSRKLTKEASIIEKMSEDGCSTKYISEVIKKSQRTVQRYIQTHISDTESAPWLPFEQVVLQKRRSKQSEIGDTVLDIINKDPTLVYNQVIDKLPDELKCNRATLRKVYRKLEITRKRVRKPPYERNDPETTSLRKIYAREVS